MYNVMFIMQVTTVKVPVLRIRYCKILCLVDIMVYHIHVNYECIKFNTTYFLKCKKVSKLSDRSKNLYNLLTGTSFTEKRRHFQILNISYMKMPSRVKFYIIIWIQYRYLQVNATDINLGK